MTDSGPAPAPDMRRAAETFHATSTGPAPHDTVEPPSDPRIAPEGPAGGSFADEAGAAARNSVTLAIGLAASWGVGLVGRLLIPRYLGPTMFGALQFADSFTSSFFVVSILGVDTYIRKEIAIRKEHGSDFFGGLIVLRLLISGVVAAGILTALALGGRPPYILRLVLLYSIYQVFSVLNTSYSCVLSAVGRVAGISAINVGGKLIWSLSIVVSALRGGGAELFAGALVISEMLKTAAFTRLVKRDAGLIFRIDAARTLQVIRASLPYWVNAVTGTIYVTADVTLMAFRSSEIEVGWYAAATSLLGIGLVLAPIIHHVFLPMTARAAVRSDDELSMTGRRTLEVVFDVVAPLALFGTIAADLLVTTIFGGQFAPAAAAFRLLCPVILLVYVSIPLALMLTKLDRGWTVTALSIGTLAMNLAMNWFAIPAGVRMLGPGGAGIAAATTWLCCELCNVTALLWLVGTRMVDARNVRVFVKTAAAAAAVLIVHQFMPPSLLSLALLICLYSALVLATRAVRVSEVSQVVGMMLRRPAAGRA